MVSITDLRKRSGGCCWSFGGVCHAVARSVMTRAWSLPCGDAVVEMADVLDGPVAGQPDGVEPPTSA